jgi:hypothetical protein
MRITIVVSLSCIWLMLPHTSTCMAEALIVDHNASREFYSIPENWIEKAKNDFHIAFGHTSHGQQIIESLRNLDAFMTGKGSAAGTYAVDFDGNLISGVLDLRDCPWRRLLGWTQFGRDLGSGYYDGQMVDLDYTAWIYTTRKYLGWIPGSGDGSQLSDYATGTPNYNSDINVIIWAWCGQVSHYGPFEEILNYLNNMTQMELDYPEVRFVYMTGHVDGTAITEDLHTRNEIIREYCRDSNKILYDFADIESWDPDGNYYGDKYVTQACNYDYNGDGRTSETQEACGQPSLPLNGDRNWALDWQDSHAEGIDWYQVDLGCNHTWHLSQNLKAFATWWMMARLAGWSGISDPNGYTLTINTNGNGTVNKSPDKEIYNPGEVVTLQANPDPGYVFDHWSGDLIGVDNPITITMDSNKYITAYFNLIDTTPPSIVSVRCNRDSVEIIFDEILDRQSAEHIGNYSINHDIWITSANLNQDSNGVKLSTSKHSEDVTYTLTVTNVEDVAGNPMGQTIVKYDYNDGLVGYWSFHEGFGSITLDSSGKDNDGIILGATWAKGRVGKALQFDGIDDYIDCGNKTALNISGDGTISTWIKIADPEYSSYMRIASSKSTWDAATGYEWEYHPSLNRLVFSGSGTDTARADNVDLDTHWHHVVAVIKGTTATLYCDGLDKTTDAAVGALVSSDYPLRIGRQSMGGSFFKGLIDEVSVYNRALSADEVTQLFYKVAVDLNGDYKVDKYDWAIFAGAWSTESGSPGWNYLCDFAPGGGDGIVRYEDLAIFCNMWLIVQDIYSSIGPTPVPAPWISADIGNPSPGSSNYTPEIQRLSITANGNDIWNQSDNFHFVYQQYLGDCEIIVRLESFPLGVDPWQKAGVMIRDTVAAGSPFVDMVITAGAGNYGSFQWRDLLNGSCSCTNAPASIGPAPKWVRLVRSGSSFSGYWSNDGATWMQIGTAHTTVMTDPVLVGMCVTSRNNDNGTKMVTATFDNLGGDFSFTMSMASTPSPVNGAADVPVGTDLTWVRGENAIEDDVYLGTDPAALSKVATISAEVLPPLYDPTENLIASSTYYWQIVETDAALFVHRGPVWNFTTISGQARVFYPPDGAVIKGDKYPPTGKPTHIYTVLDFIPGPTAVTHIGYFSDDYSKVYSRAQEASLGAPPYSSVPYRFYAGLPIVPPATDSLVRGTTYYWAVDAVDAQGNIFPGDVWEFTIQN